MVLTCYSHFSDLQELEKELQTTFSNAYATGTQRNLTYQKQAFQDFCQKYNLRPWPASVKTICLYAQHLSRHAAPTTIRNYIQGIKVWHQLKFLDTAHFDHICISLTLRGIARLKQHVPNKALPITPQLLLKIRKSLNMNDQQDVVYWALMLLSFHLMLRSANAVPQSVGKFDPAKQLVRGDVQVTRSALLVTLKWSKTLQFGGRQHVIPVLANPGSELCLHEAYTNMCERVPGGPNAPAFSVITKSGLRPVTYGQYQSKIRKSLTGIVSEPAAYSSHSFRRGGANFLFSAGVPRDVIKLVGDWRSDAVDSYIQVDLKKKVTAAKIMNKELNSLSQFYTSRSQKT